uniref:Major facilitator superfamily (MFS) profile domain-containing protein n=1 Tax=Ciona savignyi TaxID=51511 RepID=H2ZKX6_CIOSA
MPEHANASAVTLPNSDGHSDTSIDVQFECTKGSCPNSSILDYAYENELERTENQYNAPKIMPLYRRSNSVSMPISLNSNEIAPCSLNQNNCKTYGSLDHNQFVSNLVLPCNVDDILADDSCPILTEDEKPTEDIEEKLHCGFTKRQLKVFISLVLLSLNDIMGYSAISPFFPVVAAEKGLTPFQVGMIFSSYSIAGIFFSFIIGLVLVRVGAKFCVIAGMFWNAGAIICFGFIGNVGPTPFLALSIISR